MAGGVASYAVSCAGRSITKDTEAVVVVDGVCHTDDILVMAVVQKNECQGRLRMT